jgi:hypothetical protein
MRRPSVGHHGSVRAPSALVTHHHLADKQPFLNLSDLSEAELDGVMSDLESRRAQPGFHRVFGRRYMQLRRRTEQKLRGLFVEAGGKPQRTAPHYFVLGSSEWYRGLAPHTREVVIPLSQLPPDVTSFTYPDSFTAMGLVGDFGLPYEPKPYHERVFRIEQLDEIVGRHGFPPDDPDPNYAGYQNYPFEKYLEVQLWADAPIREFLVPRTP